jgi:TusA-related sulfurtransferase
VVLRVSFDSKALINSVVSQATEIAREDKLLNEKLHCLQELKLELKRCLGEVLKSLSSARTMGSGVAIEILTDKKVAYEQCIAYVKDMELSLIRNSGSNLGFEYTPRSFATPSWNRN